MKKLIDLIKNSNKQEITNFFDYPMDVQKKLVVEAIDRANESQLELVQKYDKKFNQFVQ